MKDPSMKVDAGDNLQSSLSTKISVIVFWGMILVGMITAFALLNGRETEIKSTRVTNANSLVFELAEFISSRKNFSWEEVEGKSNELMHQHQFAGISLFAEGKKLVLGQQGGNLVSFERTFTYRPVNPKEIPFSVLVVVYHPALKDFLAQERKKVLVAIGITMLAFGFLLQ